MVFSSISFLFLFLPFVFAIYLITPLRFRFIFLLFANLLFYFWGEGKFLEVMLYSIVLNFFAGILIDRFENPWKKKFLIASIFINLVFLFYYKYFNFLTQILIDSGVKSIQNPKVHLPIGISFFTFQGLSYLIDVYRKDVVGSRNFIHFAMYISLFSQLIAGPIVRYKDILNDIITNVLTEEKIVYGIQRFIVGLAKKVIIANSVAFISDSIFEFNPLDLSTGEAWLGLLCYSLQIYFDFSGYSDMAIGLGSIFGFRFLENFNYPYFANSVQDFWRRWHISLSTWFRDYLYIPLGGSKGSNSHTFFNLLIVFILCGLWHGANWTFLAWGLWHGTFLILERMKAFRFLLSMNLVLKHLYTLLVISLGWVLFRADNLTYAIQFMQRLFVFEGSEMNMDHYMILKLIHVELFIIISIAVLACTPIFKNIYIRLNTFELILNLKKKLFFAILFALFENLYYIFLFLVSISYLASGTYNPFIYFRF